MVIGNILGTFCICAIPVLKLTDDAYISLVSCLSQVFHT